VRNSIIFWLEEKDRYEIDLHEHCVIDPVFGDRNSLSQKCNRSIANVSIICSSSTAGMLQYLSSRQAIADIAAFITAFKQGRKWITYGGSYPGLQFLVTATFILVDMHAFMQACSPHGFAKHIRNLQ
jgi:hypothetical protein